MKVFAVSLLCLALIAATGTSMQTSAGAGIQYDEISRTIMMGATPPPPGAFETDLAQVHDGKIVSANPMMANMPSVSSMMMPKFGLGSIFGAIMNPMGALMGMATQALMGGIMGGVMNGMMNKYRNYESGQLQHFAYYGNFTSFENMATKKLTIMDLAKREQYELDLAAQSYKVAPFGDWRSQIPQPSGGEGSASIDVNVNTTQKAGANVEGYDTDVYETIEDVTVTNAAGGCRNGHIRFETVQYVAKGLFVPSGSSMTLDQVMAQYPQFAAGGNCAATVSAHRNGSSVPPDRLVLYSRLTMTMPEMQAQMQQEAAQAGAAGQQLPSWMKSGTMAFSMVTERGNVKPVTAVDTASLFTVPSSFKLQP
jgi:hypothetical protein